MEENTNYAETRHIAKWRLQEVFVLFICSPIFKKQF
jgi:hypothetical protein